MTPFVMLNAPVVVFDRDNVDTDQIIPARFLRKPRNVGYGAFLFHDLRRAEATVFDDATPDAAIILAGANFGCGSSREGAVYALVDSGFRCVIAPGFGDIFANNAAKNGLLTIALPTDSLAALRDVTQIGARLSVDLPSQTIRAPNGLMVRFEIDEFRKTCLIGGLDDVALTLSFGGAIAAWEGHDKSDRPWATPRVVMAS